MEKMDDIAGKTDQQVVDWLKEMGVENVRQIGPGGHAFHVGKDANGGLVLQEGGAAPKPQIVPGDAVKDLKARSARARKLL